MKLTPLTVAAALAAAAAASLLVVASGLVPVGASAGHWRITEAFLQFAMRRSIATHSLGVEAARLDVPGLLLKGAGHYETGCRSCHGAPGLPRSPIARAMSPPPPNLAERAARRTPEQLFYVVKHGVKFTGMPAWPAPGRDDEVWAVVAFLRELPRLDGPGYRALVHGDGAPSGPARSCARCHGQDGLGRGSPLFPRLAGQREDYLRGALEAYARGARRSGTMGPIAAAMGAEEMRLLSAYYAGLRPSAAAGTRQEAAVARGRAIAERGIRERRVPSCLKCHGPKSEPVKPAYPALAGQPAAYLELQLRLFQDGIRGGSAYAHLMASVAARLTRAEMRDVALYFEAMPLLRPETVTRPP
ncbi:MAG: c-type cytochrome [Elusimicrobia bacterium]|nr:c-type cytochrome [Elusimicrobiota bacterium]